MNIPGLGRLQFEDATGWHYTAPVAMRPLPGIARRFVFDDFDNDDDLLAQGVVARRFAALGPSVLRGATEWVHAYYADAVRNGVDGGYQVEPASVENPDQLWDHVTFPTEVHVTRDQEGRVYVDLECECSWEPEHGLQLVVLEGERVTKVSPHDGQLTNAHAYNRPELEGVVYVSIRDVDD